MRLALIIAALILTVPGTARAASPPPGQGTQGALSPALSHVTLVICTVPGSCPITGK